MHTIFNKLYPLLLGMLLIQFSCSEFSTKPSKEGPQFNIQVSYVDEMPRDNLIYHGYSKLQKQSVIHKAAGPEAVDQGHILVLDFSKFVDMQEFYGSEEAEKYEEAITRINEDSLSNWSQWAAVFDESFNIVTNQSFSVDQDTAVLNITGVIGLNYFILALVENDVIRYAGGDHGHGVAGEPETVTIGMTEWELYEDPEPEPTDAQFEVATTITVGEGPTHPLLSQNEEYLYVVNQTDGTVSVISTASNSVIKTIETGWWPQQPKLTPDGNFVWIPVRNSSRIDIISTTTNTIIDTIPLDPNNDNRNKIYDLAFSANGDIAFTVAEFEKIGTFIQTDTREILKFIDIGSSPNTIVVDKNNDYFFVHDFFIDQIHVVSVQDQDIHSSISTGERPQKPTLTPNGEQLYVANNGYGDPLIQVIDISTLSISSAISTGSYPRTCVFTSDGRYCYIPNDDVNTVTIFETASFAEIGEIEVASDPFEGSVSPDDKYVFFPSWNDNCLSVISVETQSFVQNISTGSGVLKPIFAQDGTIYAANSSGNTISVIRQK